MCCAATGADGGYHGGCGGGDDVTSIGSGCEVDDGVDGGTGMETGII